MAVFHQFLMILFMAFINIGLAYIRAWLGGVQVWGWVVTKAKAKKQNDINSTV